MEGNSIQILSYQNGTDWIKWRETPYKLSAHQYRMEGYFMGQIRKLCISYTEGTYIVNLEKRKLAPYATQQKNHINHVDHWYKTIKCQHGHRTML